MNNREKLFRSVFVCLLFLILCVDAAAETVWGDLDARYANIPRIEYAGETWTLLSDKPTLMSLSLEELEPVKPKKLLLVAEGIFVGLFLSIIALFIIYALDDKVKTSQDVQKYTSVMPLGVIPVTEKINGGRVRR